MTLEQVLEEKKADILGLAAKHGAYNVRIQEAIAQIEKYTVARKDLARVE